MKVLHRFSHAWVILNLLILMSAVSAAGCVAVSDEINDKKDLKAADLEGDPVNSIEAADLEGDPVNSIEAADLEGDPVNSIEAASFTCCPGYLLYSYRCVAACNGSPGNLNITYWDMQYLVCGSHKLVGSVAVLGAHDNACPRVNCPSNYCQ